MLKMLTHGFHLFAASASGVDGFNNAEFLKGESRASRYPLPFSSFWQFQFKSA
jgi:hypothetical protein